MTAPMVLDGPMNRVAFQADIELVLVPTLRRGDTVIMDSSVREVGRIVSFKSLSPAASPCTYAAD